MYKPLVVLVLIAMGVPHATATRSAFAQMATSGPVASPPAEDAPPSAPGQPVDNGDLGMADSRLTPRPLLTLAEVVGVNVMIWSYNRYIRQGGENPGFRIGFNSWQENLDNGFEWDDNGFTTNQFAHPYHGSMYFNAARANNYGFWTSVPFAFLGSYMWEHFFEIHHASYNDWIATSVGGTTLGEMMFRVSDLILDDRATGSGRAWREFGALAVNPMRGFNRIVTGETSYQGDNANRLKPGYLGLTFDVGLRRTGEEHLSDLDTTRVFMDLVGQYGDPFAGDRKRPFDTFALEVRLNFGDATALAGVSTHGLLGGSMLKDTETTSHLLGFDLNFDYANTNAYVLGGQSVTGGVTSRFRDTPIGEIHTLVQAGVVPMGAVNSDYPSYTGRDYDYGPGALARIGAAWVRNGHRWVNIRHNQVWLHTLNGTDGWHWVSLTRLRVDVPIVQRLGVGAEYQLYLTHNNYDDPELEDTRGRHPELRGFFSLPLD